MRALTRRPLFLIVLGSVFLTGMVFSQLRPAAATPAAQSEPGDPPLIDLTGYNQVIAANHGKAVMVNFWATWCAPCRTEYPMMVELSKEFGPQGLVVIGVNLDENQDMGLVRKFLATNHPDFQNFRQRPGIDADAFYVGVNPAWKGTMPQTDFYARDGHMARYFIGDKQKDAYVQAIRLILAVPLGENRESSTQRAGN